MGAPTARPRHLGPEQKTRPNHVRVIREALWPARLVEPTRIPAHPVQWIDEEPPWPTVAGVVPGGAVGPDTGVVGAVLQDLGRNTVRLAPPAPVEKPAAAAASVPAPAIQRYVEGGNVHLGAPLYKAVPPYPALARAGRVTGEVKLECVVGVDGHIREVKIIGGNPLLVRAAVEAAWKWVYAPSQLNGLPIEIVTVLTFSFHLN